MFLYFNEHHINHIYNKFNSLFFKQRVIIEGSLNYSISLSNEIELKEDDWVEILNFKITHAGGLIRTTKNKYNIKFTESTLFSKIEPINGSNFLCCANFCGIKRGLYHLMYSVGMLTILYPFLDC